MSSEFEIPDRFIWLTDAVDEIAQVMLSEAWEAAKMTPEQVSALDDYAQEMKAYEKGRSGTIPSHFFTGVVPSLAELEQRKSDLEEVYGVRFSLPEKTLLVEVAEEKVVLKSNCREVAWSKLRAYLLNGAMSAGCARSLEDNIPAVPAEVWGKKENRRANVLGRVFLGKRDDGGLIQGVPYIERAALQAFLNSQGHGEPITREEVQPQKLAQPESVQTAAAIAWLKDQVAVWIADRNSKRGKGTAWVETQLLEKFGLRSTVARALYQDDKIVPKSLRTPGRPKNDEKLAE